jgi:hypothetical protein
MPAYISPNDGRTPSSDDGIEVANNTLLWGVSLLLEHLPDLLRMAFDGFLTGSDECFEAEWLSMRILSGMGFSHRKLTDGVG